MAEYSRGQGSLAPKLDGAVENYSEGTLKGPIKIPLRWLKINDHKECMWYESTTLRISSLGKHIDPTLVEPSYGR